LTRGAPQAVRLGTRGSALALWQANHVRDALQGGAGISSEIVIIKSEGDRRPEAKLETLGVRGVFTKDLEDALQSGRIDIAVHSMKDVPSEFSDVCRILPIFQRADPRDALVSRSGGGLAQLPQRARVGTSSLRRGCQLRVHRPDLELREIRGNVDTRLRKLDAGDYDAILLAKAGMDRLSLSGRITEVLGPDLMLPAANQGILCAEFLDANWDVLRFLEQFVDRDTQLAWAAERTLLRTMQGGCSVPLGCWARLEARLLVLDACVASPDGSEVLRRRLVSDSGSVADAEALGERAAREMLDAGADRILRELGRSVG
jgi:hydroxymethylbilane synthase